MLSFFSEQCLKDAVVERVKEHQRLDQIIQGQYWEQETDGVFRLIKLLTYQRQPELQHLEILLFMAITCLQSLVI